MNHIFEGEISIKSNKEKPNFKNTHKTNPYKGKKNVSLIIIIVAFVIIAVGLGATLAINAANQGKIKYEKYTELTAAPGQEYTTIDEYGNEYDVKEDGMYCKTNYGYVKVDYGKPLGKYNTYTYVLANGSSASFELKKDGTFDYIFTYSDGGGYKATGTYTLKFGIDNSFAAMNITKASDFEDAFMVSSAVINPNDLFVVTLSSENITYFNADNEDVTYASDNNQPQNSFDDIYSFDTDAQSKNNVLDELVIYLYQDSTGDINAAAYDTVNELLFNRADINGHINVKTEK